MALNFIKYVTHSGYGSEDVTISLESTEENRAIIVLVSTYNGSVGAFDVHHTTGTEIATRVFTVNTDFTDAGVYVFSAAQHPGIGDLTIACNTGGQTASYIIIEVEGVSQDITAWAREYTTSDTYDYTTVSSNKIGYAALQFFAAAYSSYAYYSSTFSENFDSPHMEMDANYACIIAKINSEIFEWPEEHNVTTILDSGSGGGPIVGIVYIPPAEFPVTLEVSNDSFIQVPRTRELSHPGRKPVGPVEIDWSHPLSKGLMCVVIPNLQSLDQKNLVTGENFKVSAGQTLLSVGPNEEGAVMKKSSKASGNYWKLDNLLVTPTVTEGFTESFKFKPTSTDNYSYDLMGKFGAYPNYDIDASTDGLQGYIGTSLAGVWGFDHTHKPIVNEWITSTMFTRNKKRVWRVEGVDVVDPTTSSTPQNMPRQMDTFFEAYDRNRSTPGELSYYFLWSRSLNDVELKSLDENPYQFLKPKAPSIPLIFPRNKLEKDAVPIVKAKMLQPELFHPGRKPVGEVEIDWDNPLSTGLTGYFMWSAGVDGKNLAGDSKPVIDGSYNYDSVHIDSAESIQFGNMAANYNLGDSWTFTLLFRYIGGGSNYGHLWCVSDRTNDSGRVYGNGSTTNLRVLNNTVNLDFDLHDGNVHSLSLSVYHIDGAGDDSDYHRCFIDGRLMFESTVSQSDSNFESIGRELYLGTRNDFTSPGGYGYLAFAIHDRLLDMDEHRKLTSNIFGILKPKTSPQLLHTINGDQGYLPVVYDKMLRPEMGHAGRKPVGDVEIDWDHPLAQKIAFCSLMGQHPVDLITGKLGERNGTGGYFENGKWFFEGNIADYFEWPIAPINQQSEKGIALLAIVDDVAGAGPWNIVEAVSSIENDSHARLAQNQYSTAAFFTHGGRLFQGTLPSQYGDVNSLQGKNTYVANFWSDGQVNYDPSYSRTYLKGSEYTVTNNTNGSVYATTTYIPNLIRIGGFRGSIEFAIAFKEKLTEQEIRSLSNDPYQFLKPKANSPKFLAPPDQGLFLPDSRHEMPELFHPGRKPVGPVEIDWKHPLSDRLRACFLFGSASNTMNLVPEQSNAVLIGSPTFVEGSILLGALDAIKVNLPSFLTTPQGDTWTITLVFRSSGNHHSLARLWEPDIDSTGMVYRGNSDTMLAGAFSAIAGLPNLWDGAYHTLSISVYEIDGTDNLDEHRVSVDGIQYYYSTSSKISAAYTPSDGELYFGNSWALDRPANWYMAALIVHDRYMSKNEHELITHNPYQFLIPR